MLAAVDTLRPSADPKRIQFEEQVDRTLRADRCRPRAPAADRLEPAVERPRVHAAGWTHHAQRQPGWAARHDRSPRQRHRHLAGIPPVRLRPFPAGRCRPAPRARRPWARPRDRAPPGGAPRRRRHRRSDGASTRATFRVLLPLRTIASPEPRAPSPEPRAPSPEPRAPSPEPRVPSPESRTPSLCSPVSLWPESQDLRTWIGAPSSPCASAATGERSPGEEGVTGVARELVSFSFATRFPVELIDVERLRDSTPVLPRRTLGARKRLVVGRLRDGRLCRGQNQTTSRVVADERRGRPDRDPACAACRKAAGLPMPAIAWTQCRLARKGVGGRRPPGLREADERSPDRCIMYIGGRVANGIRNSTCVVDDDRVDAGRDRAARATDPPAAGGRCRIRGCRRRRGSPCRGRADSAAARRR